MDESAYEQKRKKRVAQRWSSRKEAPASDSSGSLPPRAAPKLNNDDSSRRKKSRVVSRWSSKPSQSSTPASEALSSISENTFDVELQTKRRQSVVNRWASSKSSPALETAAATVSSSKNDLNEESESESDIGDFEEMLNKRKQTALNRWGSKRS